MRNRIKTKVNIEEVGKQLQDKENRRRDLIKERLKDIIAKNNVGYREAKKMLKNELKWRCVSRCMQLVN